MAVAPIPVRRPSVPWKVVVVVVLAKASWDTAGMLLAGPRLRGLAFAAALIGALVAARCAARTGRVWPLRLCLAGFAVWYASLAAALVVACVLNDRVLSMWTPTLGAAVAVAAAAAARSAPHQVGR